MVYCGKPSRACHACRERKTRCDSNPEGCAQCAKANRVCPGYRRQVDLIFRDQSQNVIRKAQAREKRKAEAAAPKITSPASTSPDSIEEDQIDTTDSGYDSDEKQVVEAVPMDSERRLTTTTRAPIFYSSPNLNVGDTATCFFVKNYAIGIVVPGYGEFRNLTTQHVSQIMDPTLASTLKATSLASYASHTRSSALVEESRVEYMKAIRLTNAALSSPTEVTKDSTLLSVVLLGLYEMLTGRNQRSMKDWNQHVHGATALLKMRGEKQFESILGRRIFVQAASSLLTSCMQRGKRISPDIKELVKALAASSPAAAFPEYMRKATNLFQAMIDYNEFRCACNEGAFPDRRQMIAAAIEIDTPFAETMQDAPPLWDYDEYFREGCDPDIVYKDRYHVYRDIWSIAICNNIRNFRMMIHEHVRGTILAGFTSVPPILNSPQDFAQFQTSTDIFYRLQAEVLASVPQALGYVELREARPPTPKFQPDLLPSIQPSYNASSHNIESPMNPVSGATESPKSTFSWGDLVEDEAPPTHIITNSPCAPSYCGFALLWPVWYSGFSELASEDTKKYCVTALQKVGNELGVKQALILAETIVSNKEPRAWNDGS